MGCASSKNSRCPHCETSYSPIARRSFSMNVHHPPVREGDSYHVVALTSSTLGSIKLDPPSYMNQRKWVVDDDDDPEGDFEEQKNHEVGIDKKERFEMGMIEAKAWSKLIDEKISRVAPKTPTIDENRTRFVPKTPIRTPPGEPENINVEDLMEGLEDSSPLRLRDHSRSFSFHVTVDSPETRVQKDEFGSPNRTWFDAPDKENGSSNLNLISDAIGSEFDPELISAFRKALQKLSPTNPFHMKPHDHNHNHNHNQQHEEDNNGIMELEVIEKKLSAIAPIDVTQEKERVILYFTSLRGVRKTYEDCCYVRLVLKGVGVRVDERDVSMHSGFKEELRDRLGEGFKGGLPKVFVGEKYIGGVEEIRKMHEDGELEKVLDACEMVEDDGGNLVNVCEACGDIRFVPCETCSGSCKIYYEYDEDEEALEEQDECGFHRCSECNENGLVRCPICCY